MKATKVWDFPSDQRKYIIAVNAAGGDEYAVEIIEEESGNQVAEKVGMADPVELASIVALLANVFLGIVAVEVNGIGLITLKRLQSEWPHIALYSERRLDRITGDESKLFGWWTNVKAATQGDMELEGVVAANPGIIRSGKLSEELMRYRNNPDMAWTPRYAALRIALSVRAKMIEQKKTEAVLG